MKNVSCSQNFNLNINDSGCLVDCSGLSSGLDSIFITFGSDM